VLLRSTTTRDDRAGIARRLPAIPLPSGQRPRPSVLPSPNSRGELTTQLAVACLGAGVITSIAVAQGQNPLTALGITLFSAVAAVAVGQVL
jgi:hypothetical protein